MQIQTTDKPMTIDIFFADKRLSISDFECDGSHVTPSETPLCRDSIVDLLEQWGWVTIPAQNPDDVERIFAQFAKEFKAVTAAGGVVMRDPNEILMIHRNGRWDLPKGHWEVGESIEECAIREVEEECGIDSLHIERKLCETLHAYKMRGEWELKRSHWYAMRSDNDTATLTPQTEEGIERVEWISNELLHERLEGSFPTIRRVIESLNQE